MKAKKDSGFALVDLVTICIVAVFGCSIAVTSLSNSRDAKKVIECGNNLRRLVIGCHNYHDAYKRLTSGTLGAKAAVKRAEWNKKESDHYWLVQQNISSLASIAQMTEYSDVVDRVDSFAFNHWKNTKQFLVRDQQMYSSFVEIKGLSDAAGKTIAFLQCPADDLAESKVSNVVVATQPLLFEEVNDESQDDLSVKLSSDAKIDWATGYTNYLANGGASGGMTNEVSRIRDPLGFFSGPMKSRGKTRLESIPDGTSNTLMLGESLGGISNGKRTHVHSWMLGGMARGRGDVPVFKSVHPGNPKIKMMGDAMWSSVNGFGSKHESGVTFGVCDGAIAHLSRDIDMEVFYALCGARDRKKFVKLRDHNGIGNVKLVASSQESQESWKNHKDSPVIKALKDDPNVDRKLKNDIAKSYAKIVEERKGLVESDFAKAIRADLYLTADEKNAILKRYFQRAKQRDSRTPKKSR